MIDGGTVPLPEIPEERIVIEEHELAMLTLEERRILEALLPAAFALGWEMMRESGFEERITFRRRPRVPCITDCKVDL